MRHILKCCYTSMYRCIICIFISTILHLEPALSRPPGLAKAPKDAASSVGNRVSRIPIFYSSPVAKIRVAYSCDKPVYERQPSGLSFKDGLQPVAHGNTGNVLWDYAAQHLLDPNLAILVPGFNNTTGLRPVQVLLVATANTLVPSSMYPGRISHMYDGYTECVELFNNATVLMLGVGIQLEFQGGYTLGSAQAAAPPVFDSSAYRLNPAQAEYFESIAQSGGVVTVRGKLTKAVFLANGLPPPEVLGCPSFFINHNPALGATLLEKWEMVKRYGTANNLRIAVGLPKKFNPVGSQQDGHHDSYVLLKFIADNIFKVYPKSFAVLQSFVDLEYTLPKLRALGADLGPDRIKYFYDAERWIEGIRESADLLFGFRIHGTMAGVAAEVPAIVISTDHRIQELAECMGIPTVPLHDPLFDAVPFDLKRFIAAISFNSTHFDERRRQLAGGYARIFDKLGLPLHPGVKRLADLKG